MRDHYMNKREPGHQYELIAKGVMKDSVVHTYFYTKMSAGRAMAFFPPGAEWTLIPLAEQEEEEP